MQTNMEVKLIPNLPERIVDIQRGPGVLLMYRRRDENNNSIIGLIKLGAVPTYRELAYNQPQAFAIHPVTGAFAVLDAEGLLMGNIARGYGTETRVPLPHHAGYPLSRMTWCGDGSHLALVTMNIESDSLTNSRYTLVVVSNSDLKIWTRYATSEIINLSLSKSGSLISVEGHAGKWQVDMIQPFGSWSSKMFDTTAHAFARDSLRSAWVQRNGETAHLCVSTKFDDYDVIATYPSSHVTLPPEQLIWSSNGDLLFADPMIDQHRRWVAYNMNTLHWLEVADGFLRPLTVHKIYCSRNDTQAVCLTPEGPAIITF